MHVEIFVEKMIPVVKTLREIELPFMFHTNEVWSYLMVGELYISNESFDLEVFEQMMNIGAEDCL
jgi:hypothetical protein